MFPKIAAYCEGLTKEFDSISKERKDVLVKLSSFISSKIAQNKSINLIYVCTHNSRRSHFGQVWAHIAGSFYNVRNLKTFSGGTEATAFNRNAVYSLLKVGFEIEKVSEVLNAKYLLKFAENEDPIVCFSKIYSDEFNPQIEFAAIMTCDEAEVNCPFIPGAELRLGTTYQDPKEFDNTPFQEEKYDERCRQIALESMFVFSNLVK